MVQVGTPFVLVRFSLVQKITGKPKKLQLSQEQDEQSSNGEIFSGDHSGEGNHLDGIKIVKKQLKTFSTLARSNPGQNFPP